MKEASDDILRMQIKLMGELMSKVSKGSGLPLRFLPKGDKGKEKNGSTNTTNKEVKNILNLLKKGKNTKWHHFIKHYHLNKKEVLIILALVSNYVNNKWGNLSGIDLLKVISKGDSLEMLRNRTYIRENNKLVKNGIMLANERRALYDSEAEFRISQKAIDEILYGVKKASSLRRKKESKILKNNIQIKSPEYIYSELNKYVVGQDEAKKILSVAVYNHYQRVLLKEKKKGSDVKIEKSNILLLGPTGCGKTLLCKTLANILKVPFVITDATIYTETGYVGTCVEEMLYKLYVKANRSLKLAEKGIIYIDEIDKIAEASSAYGHNTNRDVSGRSVQEELLKIIEGNIVSPTASPYSGKFPDMDTSNILFIMGGAFSGLQKYIKNSKKRKIGFLDSACSDINGFSAYDEKPTVEDVIEYGMMPELMGRIPVIAVLNELNLEQLVDILTTPQNAIIKQYHSMFEMNNIKLEFTQDALYSVAKESIKRGVGARGLKGIIEEILFPYMFSDFKKNSKKKKNIIINGKDVIKERGIV